MFKTVNKDVWVFDVEWVLDPEVGRRLFELTEYTPDIDVLKQIWEKGRTDEENSMPYLYGKGAAVYQDIDSHDAANAQNNDFGGSP